MGKQRVSRSKTAERTPFIGQNQESSVYSKLNVSAQWVSPSLISPSYTAPLPQKTHRHTPLVWPKELLMRLTQLPILLMGQTTKVLWKKNYL